MRGGAAVLGEFAAALLDPEHPLPAGLVTRNGTDPATRFAVYRNNVVVSLVTALADTLTGASRLAGRACPSQRWPCSATSTACRSWSPSWRPA
jgi:hypothetical protein